jgi:putative heme degradation protein
MFKLYLYLFLHTVYTVLLTELNMWSPMMDADFHLYISEENVHYWVVRKVNML